jgi:hypothetical protein
MSYCQQCADLLRERGTLLAEVERLTNEREAICVTADKLLTKVAKQGAALAEVETARDDNAKLINLLKNSRLAMAVTMRGLALSVQSKLVAALASAQSVGDGPQVAAGQTGKI